VGRIAIDGSRTNNPAADFSPDWSPDGTKIVFDAGWRSIKSATNVFVMNADGTGVVQLTTGSGYNGNSAWGRCAVLRAGGECRR
jgi:Tol biopolymer transport system component